MLKNIDKLLMILLVGSLFLFIHLPSQKNTKEVCNFSWYVIDGDTLYINNTKFRIYGIDAPELHNQKLWVLNKTGIHNASCLKYYGFVAKRVLIKIMKSSRCVKLEYYGKDKYHRELAKIYACNESGCFDVGKYLVSQGLAISFGDVYKFEEENAKRMGYGLWKCK